MMMMSQPVAAIGNEVRTDPVEAENLEEQELVRGAKLKLAARHKRIVAGEFQGLKRWSPEDASPGVTTRVFVSFSITALLESGDRLVLQLPENHKWRIPAKPNATLQAPEGIAIPTLDASWCETSRALEFVVIESFLPPHQPLVIVLAGITTPECATPQQELIATSFKKTIVRDTVPPSTRGGQIVDGPTGFAISKIVPGAITGLCKWTPFNCLPGLVSDVALSFTTSGCIERFGRILMQLPDEDWQMDANPKVTLRTSLLDDVVIAANWSSGQKTIEFLLQDLGLPMRTPLVLTIFGVKNPSSSTNDQSSGSSSTGRVTTVLSSGGVIDGPGRIEITRISELRAQDYEIACKSFDEEDSAKTGWIEVDKVANALHRCGIKLSSLLYGKLVLGQLRIHHQEDNRQVVFKQDFLNIFAIVYAPAFKYGQQLRVHCGRGENDKAMELMARGCDVNAKDGSGWTCLHYAADFGRLTTVSFLIETCGEHGLQINATDTSGWTPLMCAAANGHVDVVKTLLDHHSDLNAVSKEGRSALHWAASRGKLDVMTVLIEQGAKVDQLDKNNWTPLHCAFLHGCGGAATLLIDKGALTTPRDKLDLPPLEYRKAMHLEEGPPAPSPSQTTRRKSQVEAKPEYQLL